VITVDLPEYRQKHILREWYASSKSAETIASELAVTKAQVIAVINNARFKATLNADKK
jgi:predicted DNA-binding protein YlxM (UPF0122 family)